MLFPKLAIPAVGHLVLADAAFSAAHKAAPNAEPDMGRLPQWASTIEHPAPSLRDCYDLQKGLLEFSGTYCMSAHRVDFPTNGTGD
jgi:hypothetical protein